MRTIKAFYEISYSDFSHRRNEEIRTEIKSKGKQYILSIDESEYKKYLIDIFTLQPLSVDENNVIVGEPTISQERLVSVWGDGYYTAELYDFTLKFPFIGSAELFQVKPTTCVMTTTEIHVDEQNNFVSFSFKIDKKDAEVFNRQKRETLHRAFANIGNINLDVQKWNNDLERLVFSLFDAEKNKYLQENDFFQAINVKINNDTSTVFSAPTITKKVIPQPVLGKNREFSSEPTMSTEMYNDVLKVINESGKSMEKKPALYQGKDEEGLRDQFLFILETRYDGTTATGETFNRAGKTDIILKYANDGSNLFVAECKFWHGGSEFLKAISQLFDRYLTWRDSKAALIIFVNNKEFSSVLATMKSEINNHSYFVKEAGERGESSFSYIFHLPQDKDKLVYFEVMAFHYDK